MIMGFIHVQNNGQEIVKSNYWETSLAKAGKYYLSTNAGAFRVLLPDSLLDNVAEMKTGETIVVTVGPWPRLGVLTPCFEIMFDDGSDSPFCLHMNIESTDGIIPNAEWTRKPVQFSVWTKGPKKVFEKPCHVRFGIIPCLKPWK
jgi:hypothetical protein